MSDPQRIGAGAVAVAAVLILATGLAASGQEPVAPPVHGLQDGDDLRREQLLPGWREGSLREYLEGLKAPATIPGYDQLSAHWLQCFDDLDEALPDQMIRYRGFPRPSLPNEALRCRMRSVTAVIAAARPLEVPAEVAGSLQNAEAAEPSALRRHLAAATRKVESWASYLELQRRTMERLNEMAQAETAVSRRLGLLSVAGSLLQDWPSTEYVLGLEECLRSGWTRAPGATAAEAFAFYDEWATIAFGASVVLGKIVPSGVAFCERARDFQCPSETLADWASPCWTNERLSACGRECPPDIVRLETTTWLHDVPCLDDRWHPGAPDLPPNAELFMIAGAGSGCEGDFQGLLAPYFSEDWDVVSARMAEGETALREEVARFLAELGGFRGVVDPTWEAFRTARAQARESAGMQLASMGEEMELERRWVERERRRIDEEADRLVLLERDIHQRENDLAAHRASQAELERELEQGTGKVERQQGALAAARDLAETRYLEFDHARARLAEVELACHDRTSDQVNEDARWECDRSLYEANTAVGRAVQQWFEAIRGRASSYQAVSVLRIELLETRRRLLSKLQEIAEAAAELRPHALDFKSRRSLLAASRELHAMVVEGHDEDQRTLAKVGEEVARGEPQVWR